MSASTRDLRVYGDAGELARAAAELFAQRAQAAFFERGRFTVALAGGSTPRPVYERLAAPAFRPAIPWDATHVFWGDERCVPPDDPDSNYRMAMEAFLSRVPIPPAHIHRMAGEQPPETAAQAAAQALRDVFGLAEGEWPRFDLILLGMGSDGHVASLFPRTAVLREERQLVAAPYVDRLGAYRLTLTLPVINHARSVVFLVAGAGKAETVRRVLEGPAGPDELPARFVQPRDGHLSWLLDEAAAAKLDRLAGRPASQHPGQEESG